MSRVNVTASLIGKKFGRLEVVSQLDRDKHGHWHWLCRCECGVELTPSGQALKSGNTKSCGCLNREATGNRRRTHGQSKDPTYRNWCAMKERCYSEPHKNYDLYGGRGIAVCGRWRESFEMFLADMGPRPFPRATVERRDTNGNYEPDNCQWATQREQTRNKRNNHLLTVDGETKTIADWSERFGINQRMILKRLTRGWTPSDAVKLPRQHRFSGPHAQQIQGSPAQQVQSPANDEQKSAMRTLYQDIAGDITFWDFARA